MAFGSLWLCWISDPVMIFIAPSLIFLLFLELGTVSCCANTIFLIPIFSQTGTLLKSFKIIENN
eukprot:6812338-Heterocapsa_arctica.AAC.1